MRQSAQYGYVESFIGKLRDELLNGEHFYVKVERTLSLYRFTIFYDDERSGMWSLSHHDERSMAVARVEGDGMMYSWVEPIEHANVVLAVVVTVALTFIIVMGYLTRQEGASCSQ